MSDRKSFYQSGIEVLKRLPETFMLKSPGSWFLWGMALLNGQTHPAISVVYAGAFTVQRAASLKWGGKLSNPVAKFLTGPQGPLFVNAATTLATGLATNFYGSRELAKACFDFSVANGAQSFIFGNVVKFAETKTGKVLKNATLGLCELGILDGLRSIAENAGFSPTFAAGLVAPGLAFGAIRILNPKLIAPSLAYADMMTVAIATGVEAATTGHWLNAVSRGFALIAFSRLAVARARAENKISIFEVETQVPRLARSVGLLAAKP